MKIKTLVSGLFEVNTYIVWCEETNTGAVIDPGVDIEKILSIIKDNNLKIEKILITHAHIDHIQGLSELKSKLNIPFAAGEKDIEVYNYASLQARLYNLPEPNLPEKIDILINEGEKITFGNTTLNTMELPGHSPGSIAYYNEEAVFCGDVIFFNSIGRTDFPGGDHNTLLNSIRNKLFKLNPEIKLYPGHGIPTTIEHEKEENPFL